MKRVAYICADSGVPVFGCKGASIHVQEVIRALVGRGVSVELFATRFGGEPPVDLVDVRHVALPNPGGADATAREQQAIAANAALRTALDAGGPFDLVYERYSLWSHAGMDWARARGIPALLEVNAPLIEEQAEHRVLADGHAAQAIARWAFTAADAVIAVSTGVAAYLGRFGVEPSKIHVVPNGVDHRRFAEMPTPHLRPEFTVGFVGSLKPWHGVSILVEAASLARAGGVPLDLLIVGDGPERGRLEAELTDTGLGPHAEFTGVVGSDRIPALLARMDVAAAPYPDLPGFYFSPLKIMEYMAAGRAIVASRIGDLEGLLEPERTALLCPPGDAAAVADALVRLYRDPALRADLGANAREVARRELGWDRVADRILSLARVHTREPAPC